jgi:hypothetical protein
VQLGAYQPGDNAAAEADNQADLAKPHRAGQRLSQTSWTASAWATRPWWSGPRQSGGGRHGGYMAQVRQAITQPITTNDNWLFWASVPKAIAEIVDFAAVHTYPFLDTFYNPTVTTGARSRCPRTQRAQAMIDATVDRSQEQFRRRSAGWTAQPGHHADGHRRDRLDGRGHRGRPVTWPSAPTR